MRSGERGSVSVEHAGLFFFVALLVSSLLGGDVAGRVATGARTAVCTVLGGCDADPRSTSGVPRGDIEAAVSSEDLPGPDASPEEVHAFFASLTEAQREELVRTHPELIGPMNGVPVELRYEANRLLMERALPALRAERDAAAEALADAQADFDRWGAIPHLNGILAGRVVGRTRALELAEAKLELTEEWARSERQFLFYDPAGDGKVVEVMGDLSTADHVAVFVPGMANDISDFENIRTRGVNLQQAVAEGGDADVASIVWLGYDPPDDPRERLIEIGGTVGSGPARAGGEDLPPFVAGILADRDRHVTVVSHSYGTIVAGHALRNGVDAEDVIFAGSPGVDADAAEELAHGYTPWAAQTPDDPIDHVPNVRVLGAGHGRDPTDPAFGAEVFDTGTATGHSEYCKPGSESLRNIARIVTGRYDDVTLCEEVGCPGYP